MASTRQIHEDRCPISKRLHQKYKDEGWLDFPECDKTLIPIPRPPNPVHALTRPPPRVSIPTEPILIDDSSPIDNESI